MVDYVEFPFDRVVGVNWAAGGPTQFSVGWGAEIITLPNDTAIVVGGLTTMDVGVANLPALGRTMLATGTILAGSPPVPVYIPDGTFTDSVDGEVSDGATGTISALYLLKGLHSGYAGEVSYSTTARGNDRFGGADSVSISIVITLLPIFRGIRYDWSAIAHAGSLPSHNLSGTVGISGGEISLTATYNLKTNSLSFS